MTNMTINIEDKKYKQFQMQAEQQDKAVSELGRELIVDYLAAVMDTENHKELLEEKIEEQKQKLAELEKKKELIEEYGSSVERDSQTVKDKIPGPKWDAYWDDREQTMRDEMDRAVGDPDPNEVFADNVQGWQDLLEGRFGVSVSFEEFEKHCRHELINQRGLTIPYLEDEVDELE